VRFHQPFYGIELEVEAPNHEAKAAIAEVICDETGQDYRLEEDGSLDCGFEVIAQPRTYAAWKKYMPRFKKDVLAPCRKAKFRSGDTKTCGLHVHSSKAAWTTKQLFRLFELMQKLKEDGFVGKVAQRENADYAKLEFDLSSSDATRALLSRCSPFNSRYVAVNITRDTIEFRLFKGNLRSERILKALEFCGSVWKFTKTLYARRGHPERYYEWLLENQKRYPNLVSFVRDDIERLASGTAKEQEEVV
jgi:hypothetical protein